MKLEKGITGFRDVNDKSEISRSNISQFKSLLYSLSYEIIGFQEEDSSRNYFKFLIANKTTKSTLDVLINSSYPYYCGADGENELGELRFTSLPYELVNHLGSYFTYLSPEQLNLRFEINDLIDLSKVELEQIKYWKPLTFGEIIFNSYD